jgi:hypothetical protein
MTPSRALMAVLLIGFFPLPAHAEPLGRLFHTAAERSALDAQRKEKSQPPKPPPPRSSAEPQAQRLDGYVLRSDGKTTLWVNGSAVAGKR